MQLTDHTSLAWIVVLYTVRLLGTAMIMMPVTTAGINALPRHLIPHGTAMNNTIRQVGGSIGTALLVSVMSNQAAHAGTTNVKHAALHGMNAAFIVAACHCACRLPSLLYIKEKETSAPCRTAAGTLIHKKRAPLLSGGSFFVYFSKPSFTSLIICVIDSSPPPDKYQVAESR